jgi:pyridoxal phosphate enzyme (YggS family)
MDGLKERLVAVEDRIRRACDAAGRDRAEVTLVAVSKKHPASSVDAAVALGLTEFGENYVQESLNKFPRPGANLHFIGSLQRNKVRKILGISSLVHGVGSLSVLEAVERIAGEEGLKSEFLLQLHLTDEPTKQGFSLDEIPQAMEIIAGFCHARFRGFMAMAPLEGGAQAARPVFAKAREALETFRSGSNSVNILSMGMSDDLEVAIAEGATHVRVGTAIFGSRPVPA